MRCRLTLSSGNPLMSCQPPHLLFILWSWGIFGCLALSVTLDELIFWDLCPEKLPFSHLYDSSEIGEALLMGWLVSWGMECAPHPMTVAYSVFWRDSDIIATSCRKYRLTWHPGFCMQLSHSNGHSGVYRLWACGRKTLGGLVTDKSAGAHPLTLTVFMFGVTCA